MPIIVQQMETAMSLDDPRDRPPQHALPAPMDAPQPVDVPAQDPEPAAPEPPETIDIPDHIKRLVSLSFTLLAILLYGAILGGAIVKTLMSSDASFTEGAVRATQILAGLVGTVVTAGFARARQSNISVKPLQQPSSLLPGWYIQSKFLGLAETLGLNITGLTRNQQVEPLEDEPARKVKINTATWVAGVYFVIYFLVGAAAFAITVLRAEVPQIITNNAWVWLGTLISNSYAFFALHEEPSTLHR